MNFNVINQVLILFIMMLVGVYSNKKGIIDDRVQKGLSDLVIKITLPCLIFNSFNLKYENQLFINGMKLLLYSIIIHVSTLILSKYIFSGFDEKKIPTLRFVTTFTNCGFMGYPVLYSIFGEIGIFYASIYNIVFTSFVWTFGVYLYVGDLSFKEGAREIVKNPAIWAVIIGGIMFLFRLYPPKVIMETVHMIGNITTPLAMIIIGSMLSKSNIRGIFKDRSIYFLSIISLILMPAIVFSVLKLLKANLLLTQICTLIMAMPGAVTGPIIASKYNGDYKYSSQCIFVTTLFSIITIPLVILFII